MSSISSNNLSELPSSAKLMELMQSLATLDAILESSWSDRYHHFDRRWAAGTQLAFMSNGQADHWHCAFNSSGAVLKGFDHESPMSPWHDNNSGVWPGVLEDLPAAFTQIVSDPSLSILQTTFCFWQFHGELRWHRGTIEFPPGPDPDGSIRLLAILDGNPTTYREWAEAYFERSIDNRVVEEIYLRKTLTSEMVYSVNPERDLVTLTRDVDEIGYPIDLQDKEAD